MEQRFEVTDMMCANCAATIRASVERLEGIDEINTDVPGKRVTVKGNVATEKVLDAIRSAGFSPQPV